MRLLAIMACAVVVSCSPDVEAGPPDADPRDVVGRAIDAMGGDSLLRGLRYLRLEGVREETSPGVATDAGIPPTITGHFDELRDVRAGVARRHQSVELASRGEPVAYTVTSAAALSNDVADELERSPERILLAALAAADLRSLADTVFGDETYHVVAFGAPRLRVYVNAVTGLPRGWAGLRSYPGDRFVWRIWGDVRTRVLWSGWSLEPGGLRYPRLQRIIRNGVAQKTVTITKIEPNPAVEPDSAPSVDRAAIRATEVIGEDVREVGPGIVFLPGAYNTVLVRQDDGVVVIEAPESAEYSRQVLAEAATRFPGLPVKAVVVTTPAWPHVGGIREYVARGIPIHTAARNAGLIRRIAASAHRQDPDSLERSPRPPLIRAVADTVTLGGGENAVQLLLASSPGSRKAATDLLVYLPSRNLLYAGDLYVPRRFEPNYWRQGMAELIGAVRRRGLTPRTVVGLHLEPTDWDGFEGGADEGADAS